MHSDTDSGSGSGSGRDSDSGSNPAEDTDVVVVGGGLCGLATAITAARRGAEVVLLEARSTPGGRGRTHRLGGALLNEGPHALLTPGVALDVLAELGVSPTGGPPPAPVWVRDHRTLAPMPEGPVQLLRRGPLARRDMVRVAAILLARRGPTPSAQESLAEWIERTTTSPEVQRVLRMLGRVATYVDDAEGIAAATAVADMRTAARRGVLYVDGGWGRIVGELHDRAAQLGVAVHTATGVERIEPGAGGEPIAVHHAAGRTLARSVVIAGAGPSAASHLLGDHGAALVRVSQRCRPVVATTLDLHLDRLPDPALRFATDLDRPLYWSVHTPSARLAEAGDVAHVMRYGRWDDTARDELESFCDDIQPGWRDRVLTERFGRSMMVAHDRRRSGSPGPAGVGCAGIEGVFVAGDWVGDEGTLTGASLASGRRAGHAAAELAVGAGAADHDRRNGSRGAPAGTRRSGAA